MSNTQSYVPATAPLHPWEIPKKEWFRLHIVYPGPYKGRMLLTIADAYSK